MNVNQQFFVNNRKKLAEGLSDQSVLILFAGEAPHQSADAYYKYYPNLNFYYLTGIDKPQMILMMRKSGEKLEEMLFLEEADPVREKWEGKRMSAEEAKAVSGIEDVKYIDQFKRTFHFLMIGDEQKYVYLDLERRVLDGPLTKAQSFAKWAVDQFPYLSIEDIYHPICQLRTFKSEQEIEQIRKALDITDKGIQNMMTNVKPGMTENELEAHFDFSLKSSGVKHHAFHSIVASGKNATILHYEDNNQPIGDNDLILVDLGAKYKYYSADISRTFPATGKFTDRQKTLYNIVLKALKETTEMIKPGIEFTELNRHTKKVLTEECKNIGLIAEDSEISKYYYHGVSHFLGLDTHDVGKYNGLVLKPGMVFTVEPGLYVEEEGIGIRIEDNVLVTEDGYENLSEDIIKTVEDIETFMAHKREHSKV